MIKIRKPILFFILIFQFCFTDNRPKLVAIGHHDYAPWNWEHNGEIIGTAAEVTKVLFGNVGVDVEFTYLGPWKRGQKLVEHGISDINICSFINEERKEYSEFITTPMGFNEQAVFVKKGNEFNFEKWSDLKGKSVGIVLGVSIGEDFDAFLEKNTTVRRAVNYEALFKLLLANKVDVIILSRNSGRAIIGSLNMKSQIVALPTPILKGSLYISMSKKSKYLYLIPEIEKQIKNDGYYDWVNSLHEKYINFYIEHSK